VSAWLRRTSAALLLLASGPAHARSRLTSESGLVDRIDAELEAWDVDGARKLLVELEKDEPNPVAVQLMQARVAFHAGEYQKAVDLYAAANAERGPNTYRQLAEDALAETRDDAVQHSAHFDFYAPQGKDVILIPYGLETLEAAYTALEKDFGFTPPGRIRVEVLNDDAALSRLSTLTIDQIRTTGTIAICKFNRLMIISPKSLVHGYEWRDTLNHEFVHLIVSMKSRNTVPIWLHEGLAKYEETRWRGEAGQAMTPAAESLLGKAVKDDKLVTFEQMHPSMALLPSQELAATAFAEVFHAIEYLKKKGGTGLWNKIIEGLKAGQTYQDAVAAAYGAPFPKFVADWKVYLKSLKYPAEGMPLEAEKLQFRDAPKPKDAKAKAKAKPKAGDAVEQTELADYREIKDPEAQTWAHLGGLMLRDLSPMLSNHYAEALMRTKAPEQAEGVLEASAKLYPSYEVTDVRLGTVKLMLAKYDQARDAFLHGLDVDPFDPALHQGLVDAFTQLKDPARADRAKEALALLQPGKSKAAASEPGAVMLTTKPFAHVEVDGKPLDRTTPTELELPAGKHHLKLTSTERGLTRELDVDVVAGESQDLTINLDEPPAP
jgi:hypothetical protein